MDTKDLPLGMMDRVRYSECSVPLERGDRVLVYTDGMSEAERNPVKNSAVPRFND